MPTNNESYKLSSPIYCFNKIKDIYFFFTSFDSLLNDLQVASIVYHNNMNNHSSFRVTIIGIKKQNIYLLIFVYQF